MRIPPHVSLALERDHVGERGGWRDTASRLANFGQGWRNLMLPNVLTDEIKDPLLARGQLPSHEGTSLRLRTHYTNKRPIRQYLAIYCIAYLVVFVVNTLAAAENRLRRVLRSC